MHNVLITLMPYLEAHFMQHMGTAKKRNVVCGGTHALLLPQSFSSDEWYTCQEYHCDASILTISDFKNRLVLI